MPSTPQLVSVVKSLLFRHLEQRTRGWTIERDPELRAWRGPRGPTPDWVCLVSSFSTGHLDDYARQGIAHAWIADPHADALSVFRLDGDTYRFVTSYREEESARIVPFDDVELDVTAFWHW